jgi:hypothetical protein
MTAIQLLHANVRFLFFAVVFFGIRIEQDGFKNADDLVVNSLNLGRLARRSTAYHTFGFRHFGESLAHLSITFRHRLLEVSSYAFRDVEVVIEWASLKVKQSLYLLEDGRLCLPIHGRSTRLLLIYDRNYLLFPSALTSKCIASKVS